MISLNKVCIGIQARSTSTRLPGKAFEMIGARPTLDHVIDVCCKAAAHINPRPQRYHAMVKVALLVPIGDEIAELYRKRITLLEGDQDDVLSRYQMLANKFDADYIVRITADCPRAPEYLISKHIIIALKNQYDYLSNVHEGIRTSPDGYDCEVISRKAMEWLSDHAKDKQDREHVTTLLRRDPPNWMSRGFVIGYSDLSHIKLSVDTKEDLDAARRDHDLVEKKMEDALQIYGRGHVHRL